MEEITKICTKCSEARPLSGYENQKHGKFGKRAQCKVCRKAYVLSRKEIEKANRRARVDADPEKYKELQRIADAKWYEKHSELSKERSRNYKLKNKESCNARSLKYRWDNIEEVRAQQREYRRLNKDKSALASAKRRAAKRRAIPKWATTEEEVCKIKALYLECKLLNDSTGIEHNVDHIVPLSSDFVCGLHCLDNLQILLGSINKKKNNRYWPDMP